MRYKKASFSGTFPQPVSGDSMQHFNYKWCLMSFDKSCNRIFSCEQRVKSNSVQTDIHSYMSCEWWMICAVGEYSSAWTSLWLCFISHIALSPSTSLPTPLHRQHSLLCMFKGNHTKQQLAVLMCFLVVSHLILSGVRGVYNVSHYGISFHISQPERFSISPHTFDY